MMVLSRAYLESFVCERFKNDPHYRVGHLHILAPAPGTVVIGLHTPEMKKIAKKIAGSDLLAAMLLQFASHEPLTGESGLTNDERTIWGLVIDYVKCPLEERLGLIDAFLPCIDNWSICDTFCCNSACVKRSDREVLWRYIVKLLHSGKEWNIRVGTVLAICHFLEEGYISRTLPEIDSIGLKEGEPYYVRMGIAWLLATALAKNADRTRDFIRSSSLPIDIIKMYVRKARESFRTRTVQPV